MSSLVAATVQSKLHACRVEKCLTVRNEASPVIACSRHNTVRKFRLHAGENAKRHDAATRWRLRFVVAADQQLRGGLCGSGKLRYIGGTVAATVSPRRYADTPVRCDATGIAVSNNAARAVLVAATLLLGPGRCETARLTGTACLELL